jgi:mono/diheme cytochrome c family protein
MRTTPLFAANSGCGTASFRDNLGGIAKMLLRRLLHPVPPHYTAGIVRKWSSLLLILATFGASASGADKSPAQLDARFRATVQPFLQTYCVTCHGKEDPKADMDLSAYSSMSSVVKDEHHLDLVLERLEAGEMPPKKAKAHPSPEARSQAVAWFQAVRDYESKHNAGDPGLVLARRLNNAEYNYTIRDLIGVDIQPTREFPEDPSSSAGFDNSGESLVMSPSLLNKYLKAAREVASYMYLKPEGFAFAPHPMLVETDRDQLCVGRIIDFYHCQDVDYADYFQAAWCYKYRRALGKNGAAMPEIAAERKVSAKYLGTIWTTLEGTKADAGPLAKLQSLWRQLPAPGKSGLDISRPGCEQMRDYVVALRKKVEPRFWNITAGKVGAGAQPFLIWKNVQYATHRMTYDPAQLQVEGEPRPVPDTEPEPGATGEFGPGHTRLITNDIGDPDLVVPVGQRARYEEAFALFCRVFPDMFYMQERGRNYFDTSKDRGRYLSAGFHSLVGYFRDDQPLYELILDSKQQKELDEMWLEMDFVASATARMYTQFYANGSRQGGGGLRGNSPAPPSGESKEMEEDVITETRIRQLEATYLTNALGGDEAGIGAIKEYFEWINQRIRSVEKARLDAEPGQLKELLQFAAKAYRRPLSQQEKDDLLGFYRSAREKDGLDHEAAMRECIVSVLMSPDLTYRIDLVEGDKGIHPLSDYSLASRLSYFLWSSMPDEELLAHAAAGDLHRPKVIAAQARRMLKDPRARALAVEFGGNWLDFRHFEEINTVDRDRFPAFNSELREAMFEEPVRFLMDVFQNDRSVLDLLYARDTFVNPILAKHYGIPVSVTRSDDWVHITDASQYDRGGLLPMAVFLTKNAPGLRTSPVKRGNWVVKNVLGERIPPPPPVVPELPHDEAKLDLPLRDILARHRADPSCAACHARFDSLGLVFEGFGPVGERREKDFAGHPIDASATFPDHSDGAGLEGLRRYIHDRRQNDFVNNVCGKLLACALGRSLIASDDSLIQGMRGKLAANDYRFEGMIESIVTSRQFLTKRGRDDLAAR